MYKITIEVLEEDEINQIDIVCESMKRVIDFIEEMERIHKIMSVVIARKEE